MKKGRSFENMIAALQKQLNSELCKITSPDYFIDEVTGEKREVDVSIKGKMGSHDVLVIIECRDRIRTNDVTWIEQIKTKGEDIGANKIIAVSSSGFSKGARIKAKYYNVELRTIKEINADTVLKWISPESLPLYYNNLKILDVKIFTKIPIALLPMKASIETPIFMTKSGEKLSVRQVIPASLETVFDGVTPNATGVAKSIDLFFGGDLTGLQLISSSGFIELDHLELSVEASIKKVLSPRKMKEYRKEEECLVQFAEHEMEFCGNKYIARILKRPNEEVGKIQIQRIK